MVDDEVKITELVGEFLLQKGHYNYSINNGAKALEYLRSYQAMQIMDTKNYTKFGPNIYTAFDKTQDNQRPTYENNTRG